MGIGAMRILLLFLLLPLRFFAFSQNNLFIADSAGGLNHYTLFLKGEFHNRRAENEESLLLIVGYLHAHHNLRHLVFEYGPDFSYLANRYLQTPTDSMVNKRYLAFSKPFWDSLIQFNRSRPANERVKIYGFDFNRSVFTARALDEMTLNKPPLPDSAIEATMAEIIKWKNVAWTWEGQDKFVGQMKDLKSVCKGQEGNLAAYFGSDWPAFSAILSHNVKSKSTVDRDKAAVKYIKAFLNTRGEGNVLFNYGISHTFLDGIGFGKMLNEDPQYRGKVCSLYPYYQLPLEEKSKIEQRKDSYLPQGMLPELEGYAGPTLVNAEQRGFYPKSLKISQWVYVIPKAKQP